MKAGRVAFLHETGFLHIKGIKIFGYEIVVEKESEKNSKFSKKNNIVALSITIEKTQVAQWITEDIWDTFLLICYLKRFSNYRSLFVRPG